MVEPAFGSSGVRKHRSERLVDFVGNGGRELAHYRNTIRVRELCLGVLSLGQV